MRLSIRVKLILGIASISIFVFGGLALIFLFHQRDFLIDNFRKQALLLAQALNAAISSEEMLYEREMLQNNIYKLMWLNPDIIDINISARNDDTLQIIASNKSTLIGKTPTQASFLALQKGTPFTEIRHKDREKILAAISPIHAGGRIIGVNEITLSLKPLEDSIRSLFLKLILFFSLGILSIILGLSLLMQFIIINPINVLGKAMRAFGAGNFQFRIKYFPKDEFGELAQGFNEMSKSLEKKYLQLQKLNQELEEAYKLAEKQVKERTKELEEERASLEQKIKERTKELEKLKQNLEEEVARRTKELKEKIEELEKIQKLTTGRELKMIQLKEEIERLKQELKRKKK
ncbi:HAMP domain-containing protein [bacterium]|nr:HAMP domain-containing protein [bacterium]